MKLFFLTLQFSLLLFTKVDAQTKLTPSQNRGFALGPVLSVDHFTGNVDGYYTDKGATVRYTSSFSYGLDASYLSNRILINAQVLTSMRSYDLITNLSVIAPDITTNTAHIRVSAHYYALPITVSYKVNSNERLQLFAGIGGIGEWVPGTFERQSFDYLGGNQSAFLSEVDTKGKFVFGLTTQATLRYHLTNRLLLQLEPALRYFHEAKTPYVYSGSKTGLSGSLTLGYKFH